MSNPETKLTTSTAIETAAESALVPRGETLMLAPRTFSEAMEYAKMIARSALCPPAYRNKPEDVFVAMQHGAELGLAPLQSLNGIAVINNRPGVFGDLGVALLRAKGFDIQIHIEGAGDQRVAFATISHPRQQPTTRSFSVDDAKTAGLWRKAGPWTNYPTRMLAWRAFWWAARDAAADILHGVQGAEELGDFIEAEVIETADAEPPITMPKRRSAPPTPPAQQEPAAAATTPAQEQEQPPEATVPPPVPGLSDEPASESREPGDDDDDEAEPEATWPEGALRIEDVEHRPRARRPYFIVRAIDVNDAVHSFFSFHATTDKTLPPGALMIVTKQHADPSGVPVLDEWTVVKE